MAAYRFRRAPTRQRRTGRSRSQIVQEMLKAGWQPHLNELVDGADYDMTAADGRVLHFNAIPVPACKQVQLTVDARWITG